MLQKFNRRNEREGDSVMGNRFQKAYEGKTEEIINAGKPEEIKEAKKQEENIEENNNISPTFTFEKEIKEEKEYKTYYLKKTNIEKLEKLSKKTGINKSQLLDSILEQAWGLIK